MCGKLQCTNVDVNNPPPGAQISVEVLGKEKCINVDFNLGTDVLDPGYVNSGSPCENGKVGRQTISEVYMPKRRNGMRTYFNDVFQDNTLIVKVK